MRVKPDSDRKTQGAGSSRIPVAQRHYHSDPPPSAGSGHALTPSLQGREDRVTSYALNCSRNSAYISLVRIVPSASVLETFIIW